MLLENMILGQIGEHHAKCRAVLLNIVKNQRPHVHIHDDFFFDNIIKYSVNIRIARPRNALWRAILRRAILSTSFIRIVRPIYFVFFCVDMTFNWFQMLFRASVQDLYALEKFQSTRQQQHLRETQVEVDLDTRCSTSFKLHTSVDL